MSLLFRSLQILSLLLVFLLLLLSRTIESKAISTPTQHPHNLHPISRTFHKNNFHDYEHDYIDEDDKEDGFSRQVLVHGRETQHLIRTSTVFLWSKSLLGLEITKNLLLMGFNDIRFVNGTEEDIDAVREFNSTANITSISSSTWHDSENVNANTIVVCAGYSLAEMEDIYLSTKQINRKFIGCNVLGACGYVGFDFRSQDNNAKLRDMFVDSRTLSINDCDTKRGKLRDLIVACSLLAWEDTDIVNELVNLRSQPSFLPRIDFLSTRNRARFRKHYIDKVLKEFSKVLQPRDWALLDSELPWEEISDRFMSSSLIGGQCPALLSVVGGYTAHAVINGLADYRENKADTRKLRIFENLDAVDISRGKVTTFPPTSKKALLSLQNVGAVYGISIAKELSDTKLFLVGAGAIGCEIMKLLVQLGVGTAQQSKSEFSLWSIANSARNMLSKIMFFRHYGGPLRANDINNQSPWDSLRNGGLVVTDMDSIEGSNLHRQFLYRASDIGRSKSTVAIERILESVPSANWYAIQTKVNSQSAQLFGKSFSENIDVVMTALDNVPSRRFVDELCVSRGKWMIDSGTVGTKGSTQVVIPFISESYSSSIDVDNPAIPICSIKSFPTEPEHCVAWARELFLTQYQKNIEEYRRFAEQLETSEDIDVNTYAEDFILNFLNAGFHLYQSPKDSSLARSAIVWAHRLYHDCFVASVERLLREHPLDELDDEGLPFWESGGRRVPTPQPFNKHNSYHIDFIRSSAFLYMKCLSDLDPSNYSVNLDHLDEVTHSDIMHYFSMPPKQLRREFHKACSSGHPISYVTKEVSFDKDDFENRHVAFLSSAANIRSSVFRLSRIDRLVARKIAGNIIPAIVTTTAATAGLASIELIKIAQQRVLLRSASRSIQHHWSPMPVIKHLMKSLKAMLGIPRWRLHQSIVLNTADDMIFEFRPRTYRSIPAANYLLPLFKNSYIDLKSFSSSHSQPFQVEFRDIPSKNLVFSDWDHVDVRGNTSNALTFASLNGATEEMFGLRLVSASVDDSVLFADYLPNAESLWSTLILDSLAHAQSEASTINSTTPVPNNGCTFLSVLAEDEKHKIFVLPRFRILW